MNQDNTNKPTLIDELRSIREALNKAPATNNPGVEIPLLDEIIRETANNKIDEIPVLADPIELADKECHQLALKSWQLVEKKLYLWTTTMDNPVSILSEKLFNGMSSQLASNWELLFTKQTPQQLQLWKQLLLDDDSEKN